MFETIQGYGSAIRRGLAETPTPTSSASASRTARSTPTTSSSCSPFTADVDVVFGSRTVQTFILSGANMGWFLRWGNWAVAKLTEVLFNTVYLSDVGCTFRVLTRDLVGEDRDAFE